MKRVPEVRTTPGVVLQLSCSYAGVVFSKSSQVCVQASYQQWYLSTLTLVGSGTTIAVILTYHDYHLVSIRT